MTWEYRLTKAEAWGQMTPVARVLYMTGCLRVYQASAYASDAVFRWWHPVSWLVFLVAIPICAFRPYSVTEAVPFRLDRRWRARKGEIRWL